MAFDGQANLHQRFRLSPLAFSTSVVLELVRHILQLPQTKTVCPSGSSECGNLQRPIDDVQTSKGDPRWRIPSTWSQGMLVSATLPTVMLSSMERNNGGIHPGVAGLGPRSLLLLRNHFDTPKGPHIRQKWFLSASVGDTWYLVSAPLSLHSLLFPRETIACIRYIPYIEIFGGLGQAIDQRRPTSGTSCVHALLHRIKVLFISPYGSSTLGAHKQEHHS